MKILLVSSLVGSAYVAGYLTAWMFLPPDTPFIGEVSLESLRAYVSSTGGGVAILGASFVVCGLLKVLGKFIPSVIVHRKN